MKIKTVHVTPKDADTSNKIEQLAKQLRMSRSAIVGLALDFVMPRIERGEAQVVNGEVVLVAAASKN